MTMGSNSENLPGLNLLSLDEGGITGLSSLYILRELMTRLQGKNQLPKRPEPFEYFDMIAGTGTGAISAVMLGRLRIPLDDAIDRYINLMSDGFFKKFISHDSEAFKATKLEEALKKTVVDADKLMMEENPKETKCKVVIYAMSAHNMRAGLPCAFRTYPSNVNVMPDCQVWKALRASTAHPLRFKGIEIEELGVKCRFIGGMFGCSNPTAQLLAEASKVFPRRFLSSVTSIGSGSARTIQILQASWLERLFLTSRALKAALEIATDNEGVAHTIGSRFSEVPNVYYRLNVDIDLQSNKATKQEAQGHVAEHTTAYLQQPTTQTLLDSLVESIRKRAGAIPVTYIDGHIVIPAVPISMGLKYFPFVTFMFKGRKLQIGQIAKYFGNKEALHVFVLYGPSGAGKTQLALKYAESEAWNQKFDGVLFIDGSSRISIETALIQFAVAEKLGQEYTDTLDWLGSKGRWLMLFDNVEDPRVQVEDYFPRDGRYDVLITTRHEEIISLARGENSTCEIEGMDQEHEEALDLLLEASALRKDELEKPEQVSEITAANELLKKLGHLPLAITQCGAYISWKKCSITQYREIYDTSYKRLESSENSGQTNLEANNYAHPVQLTWKMNNESIGRESKQLWHLIAFLGRNGISEEIFRRACENKQYYQPQEPLGDSETEARQQIKNALSSFTSNGVWSSRLFLAAMNELVGLSLVTFDTVNEEYQVHPQVQELARTAIPEPNPNSTFHLLEASRNHNGHAEDSVFTRAMAPHFEAVAMVKEMRTPVTDSQNRVIGEEHLGPTSRATGPPGQTEESRPQISDIQETVPEVGHPNTAADEAINPHDEAEVRTPVANAQEPVAGEHPSPSVEAVSPQDDIGEIPPQTLDVQEPHLEEVHSGTAADAGISPHNEAEGIHTFVGNAQEPIVEEKDPSPSAEAASSQNKPEETSSQISDTQEPALEEEHSDLPARGSSGPHGEKEKMGIQVENAPKLLTEENYPNSEVHGSDAISPLGQAESMPAQALNSQLEEQALLAEAEALGLQAIDAQRRELGEDHPETLQSMADLAVTYTQLGKLAKARSLGTEVLASRTRVLGLLHPDTMQSMRNLAQTYQTLGQKHKYEALMAKADAIKAE